MRGWVAGRGGAVSAVPLTDDHKPERQDERLRITLNNGRVAQVTDALGQAVGPFRVWHKSLWTPGLAMSRAFGDLGVRSLGVVPTPEHRYAEVGPEDKYLVLGTDGVWDHISNDDAAQIVTSYRDVKHSCAALVDEAHRRWREEKEGYVDDITAVVVKL